MFEIGPSLREARTKRGLSPEDVQKAIRIRGRYLNALEEEEWAVLPGDAYTKGFLRTYAEFLGLNGNLYVDEFTSRFARREDEPFVPEALASAGAGVGVLRPLAAIAAIVAVVGAVAAWKLHPSSSPTAPAAQPVAAKTPAKAVAKPAPTGASAPRQHAAKKPVASSPTTSRAVLTAARGPVWLLVRAGGATGRVLYEGVLPQGRTLPVSLAPTVWVRVGAPWNLDVRVGGRPVAGLPPQPGNLVLSARGLAPA